MAGELREVRDALDALPAFESARAATDLIRKAGLSRLNLVDYLAQAGYEGPALARAIGPFGVAVKHAYVTRHGFGPIQALDLIRGEYTPVAFYFESDRDLVDAVYAAWESPTKLRPDVTPNTVLDDLAELKRILALAATQLDQVETTIRSELGVAL